MKVGYEFTLCPGTGTSTGKRTGKRNMLTVGLSIRWLHSSSTGTAKYTGNNDCDCSRFSIACLVFGHIGLSQIGIKDG